MTGRSEATTVTPPTTLLPPPYGTTVQPRDAAVRSSAATAAGSAGCATPSGTAPRRPVRSAIQSGRLWPRAWSTRARGSRSRPGAGPSSEPDPGYGDRRDDLVERRVGRPARRPDELPEERHRLVGDVLLDRIIAPAVPAPHREPPGISCAPGRSCAGPGGPARRPGLVARCRGGCRPSRRPRQNGGQGTAGQVGDGYGKWPAASSSSVRRAVARTSLRDSSSRSFGPRSPPSAA